jgi:hypothetical protein
MLRYEYIAYLLVLIFSNKLGNFRRSDTVSFMWGGGGITKYTVKSVFVSSFRGECVALSGQEYCTHLALNISCVVYWKVFCIRCSL